MTNEQMNEIILNKQFSKVTYSGYDANDVDQFFDMVIEYLKNNDLEVEKYQKSNLELKTEKEKLLKQIATLEKQKEKLENEIQSYKDDGFERVAINKKLQNQK